MKNKILYVVIPCYNEEDVLPETSKKIKNKLDLLIKNKKINRESKVMFVNDGSKDKTWLLIKELSLHNSIFTGINLSRNRGHQNALLAGLMCAKEYADIVVSMDADLQDDIDAIDEMIEKYNEGAEIVYGVRNARKKDTWFKRVTAEGFYKVMKFMGVDIIFNHADYRLTSKNILEELAKYDEVNLFLRGIFPLIGYKTDIVYYERSERFAGESKYPLKKMLNFAFDGITSFSIKPIRFIMISGLIITIISFIFLIVFIIINLTKLGHLSTETFISIACLFFGIQTFNIGLIGEYVGKTYIETKSRPRYVISEKLMDNE